MDEGGKRDGRGQSRRLHTADKGIMTVYSEASAALQPSLSPILGFGASKLSKASWPLEKSEARTAHERVLAALEGGRYKSGLQSECSAVW